MFLKENSIVIITLFLRALIVGIIADGFFLCLAVTSNLTQADDDLPYYNSAEFTPHWYELNDEELINFYRLLLFACVSILRRRVLSLRGQKRVCKRNHTRRSQAPLIYQFHRF